MDEPLAAPRSLRTRRLLLRAWDPADAPLLRAELDASDAHLRPWVPFLKGEPRTVEATRDRLAAFRDAFASGRQLVYGIFTADASRVLGEAMLFGDSPVRELGFWTAVDVGRQGFAREATQALLDLARGLLPTTAVHLRCAPDNLASAALAERLGFTYRRTSSDGYVNALGHEQDTMHWELAVTSRTRAEQPGDEEAVRRVEEAAFEAPGEARLVDRLRAKPGVISLVAESDGEIAGHVLLSLVVVEGSRAGRALALGPMAVHPDHQQKGLGRALVRHAIAAAEAASADVLVVLGHPDYYPRFGFRPARASGLLTTYDVPDDVFLALPLVGDATVPRGLVRYHDAFAALD